MSITIGSGSRRNVHLGPQEPDPEEDEDEEPARQFRMPNYHGGHQRLRLQLNYAYPLHSFIVVTLGKPFFIQVY